MNWNAVSAIATTAMALTTLIVIIQTAINHRALLTQQLKEHMDRFKPICVLVPYSGVDPLYQRRNLITVTSPTPDNPAYGIVALRCTLQNVGVGSALKLQITFSSDSGQATDPWELSPLGASDKHGSVTTPLLIPIRADECQLFDVSWQIWLEYEDVFGRKFKSVHRSTTYESDSSTYEWVGPEGQKKARLRFIPWVAFQDK